MQFISYEDLPTSRLFKYVITYKYDTFRIVIFSIYYSLKVSIHLNFKLFIVSSQKKYHEFQILFRYRLAIDFLNRHSISSVNSMFFYFDIIRAVVSFRGYTL